MATPSVNEALFDEKLAQLEGVRAWSPRVISRLETFIRTADDYDLFRINPIRYATDRAAAENEVISLFLYATKFGLFQMEWHLVCPSCGHVVESLRELTQLHAHFICANCYAESTATMDDYIQVTFTVSPQIRDISFHHPELLSAQDFFIRYVMSKGIVPLPDGTTYAQFLTKYTLLLSTLGPQEKIALPIELATGILLIRSRGRHSSLPFLVVEGQNDLQNIPVKLVQGKFQAAERLFVPLTIQRSVFVYQFDGVTQIPNGKTVLDIQNMEDKPNDVFILHFPLTVGMTPIEFEPYLTGKRLLTTQTFRELFRTELVQANEGIGVKDITFLFTDLKGSTALYEMIGDPKAYYLVRQHFDTLGRVIDSHSGAIVKTIGDAVMATFMNPVDALSAAVEMLKEIEHFNRAISEDLILKIGIHSGHSIVVTLNDRLDYFGQTVNIAARVQGLAEAGEIYVSQDAYRRPGVGEVLNGCEVVPEQASVKGVSETLQVYKVTVK